MKSNIKNIVCPACQSENIAVIMYGMPAFSPELMEEIKIGTKKLGGCCVRAESPDYTCNNCGKEWKDQDKIGMD